MSVSAATQPKARLPRQVSLWLVARAALTRQIFPLLVTQPADAAHQAANCGTRSAEARGLAVLRRARRVELVRLMRAANYASAATDLAAACSA